MLFPEKTHGNEALTAFLVKKTQTLEIAGSVVLAEFSPGAKATFPNSR